MNAKPDVGHTDRMPVLSEPEGQEICDAIFAWLTSGASDFQCCHRMAELLAKAGYPISPEHWPADRLG